MAIDYDKLMNWRIPEVRERYMTRDTILYALGVGLGSDPTDEHQLRFVYEKNLLALPTYPLVLGYPGFWLKDPGTGVDWVKVVAGEQGLRIHRLPLPEGEVVGLTRVSKIVDKGPGKGALIYTTREVRDAAGGDLLCELTTTSFCRGDGGFGGPEGPVPAVHELPQRSPDQVCDLPTLPQAALIYRLKGDYNPLHAEPAVARAAGFDRPILHGLCSMGVAGHALLKTVCDYDPTRLAELNVRFSAPVLPGETLRTEIWRDGEVVSFRTKLVERDVVVLNNGRAVLRRPGE
ncbi:MAG: MaoC/PaaZ C-terminal domain-containing protein [Pseudomonadota bacterium]